MELNQSDASERFVFRALAWSLAIHLLCYGAWKWGQTHGWWQSSTPRWMQALTKKLLTPVTVKIAPPPKKPLDVPLIFVDTDPALAMKEPPPNAKYYSANNTPAANTEIKHLSDIPNITGHQQHVPKPTDSSKSKAQPLEPTPKAEDKTEEQPESKPKPRQSMAPGDLAMAKPANQKQPDDGKAETNPDVSVAPQPAPHHFSRLDQVPGHNGITGEKMRQDGGVPRQEREPSFAAVGKSYGDYDAELIDAVSTCWHQLLQDRMANVSGEVVVEFRLLPTGAITDVKVTKNTVDEFYATICSLAISKSAPFRPWPRQMQLDLGSDHRDVQFTFYYENE
jgi:outer membrane biosynthesis protein TonB